MSLPSTMNSAELTIDRLLRHMERVHGDVAVTTCADRGFRRSTMGALAQRARKLGSAVDQLLGTCRGPVGTFMWNNQEHVEAYFGIPAVGRVLHTVNVRLAPKEAAGIMRDAGDAMIIVDSSLLGEFNKVAEQVDCLRHVILVGDASSSDLVVPAGAEVHRYEDLLASAGDIATIEVSDERSAAVICYTSGTTGAFKGVVYSHRSIWLHAMHFAMGDRFPVDRGDTILPVVPQFHALAWGIPYTAALVGTGLALPDRFSDPSSLLGLVEASHATVAAGVPTIWYRLLDHLEGTPYGLGSLREVIVGGAACPPDLIRRLYEQHGVKGIAAWGMTEVSPVGAVARPPRGMPLDEELSYRATPGRVLGGVEARIVDEEGREAARDGHAIGELQVRGPWVTSSYFRGEHADAFDGDWLRTGDMATIAADGDLRIVDRIKDAIKSGGEWISTIALETALQEHPSVAEAAVIGVPDQEWGERPAAFVALVAGEELSEADLKSFLAGKFARWQIPQIWHTCKSLPRTSVGKLNKRELR